MTFPWPVGSATGIGSLPGTDIAEAQRIVLGELPDLPYLPELPARGPGADMIGRGGALLAELPVELYAARWRVASRPGHDLRRRARPPGARPRHADRAGIGVRRRVQDAGGRAVDPGRVAASCRSAAPVLRDPGAVRDLAASLAEGLARARRDGAGAGCRGPDRCCSSTSRRCPRSWPGGCRRRAARHAARGRAVAWPGHALAAVVAAADVPVVVHCCAPDVPVRAAARGRCRGASRWTCRWSPRPRRVR